MKKSIFFFAILIVFLGACNKAKDPQPAPSVVPINAGDPQAVSSSLKISRAQKINGIPPSSSLSPDAPVITASENNIKAMAGKTTALAIDLEQGDAAGVYLKVKGSNEYFKIPLNAPARKSASNNKALRMMEVETNYLAITLPASIQPGTFCFEYWVYNEIGSVSNMVVKCVDVVAMGGSNANFLYANNWELYKYTYYELDVVEKVEMFKPDSSFYTINVPCTSEPTGSIQKEIYSVDKSLKADFVFQSNGAGVYSYKYSYTSYDYENTNCNDVAYKTEIDEMDMIVGWNYNDETKKLVVVFDYNDGGDDDPFALEFDVTVENGIMTWYDPIANETYYLRKK